MLPEPYPYPENGRLAIWAGFPRKTLPNGRTVVQLTSGAGFCYPLYYFIPSFSKDLKYLVYHRANGNEVQLHRLDLESGRSIQLTHGRVEQTGWDNWDDEAGRGVLDHRSVLNVARNEVIYFDGERGEEVWSVNLETHSRQRLFILPEDYYAGGQNCVSPDGKHFVYIVNPHGSKYLDPDPNRPSKIVAYAFATGLQKTLCEVYFHIHHVIPYGNGHFVSCHTPNGCGLFMTSLENGGYSILRAKDPGIDERVNDGRLGGHPCHYVTTRRGIAYEVVPMDTGIAQGEAYKRAVGVTGGFLSGLYDPISRTRFEFPLPDHFVGTHIGWDPRGDRWFWEIMPSWENASANQLIYLHHIGASGEAEFLPLTPKWMNFGTKQKSHHHPQITPDSDWLLFVAGDESTETNHLHLLDISDLPATEGIGPEKLSPGGTNDIARLQ